MQASRHTCTYYLHYLQTGTHVHVFRHDASLPLSNSCHCSTIKAVHWTRRGNEHQYELQTFAHNATVPVVSSPMAWALSRGRQLTRVEPHDDMCVAGGTRRHFRRARGPGVTSNEYPTCTPYLYAHAVCDINNLLYGAVCW